MMTQPNHSRARAAWTAVAAASFATALFIGAERPTFAMEGPFAGLAGSWSGNGTVSLSDKGKERIRCRATYTVGGGGTNLQQALRCASDSYNFDLRSDVTAQGGTISGSWSEATRNLNGRISGRSHGNQIDALVETAGFSATITIVTRDGRQSVSIRSLSQEFSGASISLSRT